MKNKLMISLIFFGLGALCNEVCASETILQTYTLQGVFPLDQEHVLIKKRKQLESSIPLSNTPTVTAHSICTNSIKVTAKTQDLFSLTITSDHERFPKDYLVRSEEPLSENKLNSGSKSNILLFAENNTPPIVHISIDPSNMISEFSSESTTDSRPVNRPIQTPEDIQNPSKTLFTQKTENPTSFNPDPDVTNFFVTIAKRFGRMVVFCIAFGTIIYNFDAIQAQVSHILHKLLPNFRMQR